MGPQLLPIPIAMNKLTISLYIYYPIGYEYCYPIVTHLLPIGPYIVQQINEMDPLRLLDIASWILFICDG
jgi:hypothetical protein